MLRSGSPLPGTPPAAARLAPRENLNITTTLGVSSDCESGYLQKCRLYRNVAKKLENNLVIFGNGGVYMDAALHVGEDGWNGGCNGARDALPEQSLD